MIVPYQGPLVRNLNLSPVDGYLPAARGLNAYMVAQSSYAVGGIPTSGTNANPVVITQPAITQLVVNTGSAVPARSVNATTVTLPTVASQQDVYVDVDTTGAYSTHGGAVGFAPPAVAANALRLYLVRTGTGGVGVAFITALAATGPFSPPLSQVMNTNGTNASAVSLPSSLAVAQAATLADVTVNAGLLDAAAGESFGMFVGSATVSSGFPPAMTVTPSHATTSRGVVSFSIASMSNVTGVTLYAYSAGIFPVWGGLVTAQDAPTASLGVWTTVISGVVYFIVPNYNLMIAGTTYRFCYRLFCS